MTEENNDSLASSSLNNPVEVSSVPLTCPLLFPFPFEPYPIQSDFMRNIFYAIEERKIGIFESPTGTGKSLSMICGALTWLKQYKESMEASLKSVQEKEKAARETSSTGSDWLSADYEKTKLQESLKAERIKIEKDFLRELEWKKRREKLAEKRKGQSRGDSNEITECLRSIDNSLKDAKHDAMEDAADTHLLPDDYNSDDEEEKPKEEGVKLETSDMEHVRKIYFCTRTHSQITQFISELRRSPFGSQIRVSALASRQNLCLFDPVRKLKSQRLMNDRCIELQKGSKKSSTAVAATVAGSAGKKRQKRDQGVEKSCPYYKKENMESLSTRILSEVFDIEEAGKAGIAATGCPYYASRLALPDAEVVTIPYNLILHRPTREASGICLKDQIVIIDEAHNLLDAIAGMYSAEITERQVKKAHSQLQQYFERYRSRFTPKNTLYIKQLLLVLKRLGDLWKRDQSDQAPVDKRSSSSKIFTIIKFISMAKLESVNLFKILAYCRRSFISRKLSSFTEIYVDKGTGQVVLNQQDGNTSASPLMMIESFLETLTNADKDGRIVCSSDVIGGGRLKFLLLNPAVYVSDLFQSARSVILAGGTMRPVSDFEDQLLKMAGVPSERVHKFACGHIVPPENVLPIALQAGPNGMKFEFNYENRNSQAMIMQLGCLLVNICNIVPGGIVCFLSSYEYEDSIFTAFSKTGDTLKSISRKKIIFREPKLSSDVPDTLKGFTRAISNPVDEATGAILFAVVGGKLSEGINFSDDLGRCVIMVGLPYPNIHGVELTEKMDFLNLHMAKSANGQRPGTAHYEGLCMKAVNQSIGRAIRHRNDYAAILLVDSRYGSQHIQQALPEWIGGRLQVANKFNTAFAAIRQFFGARKIVQST